MLSCIKWVGMHNGFHKNNRLIYNFKYNNMRSKYNGYSVFVALWYKAKGSNCLLFKYKAFTTFQLLQGSVGLTLPVGPLFKKY